MRPLLLMSILLISVSAVGAKSLSIMNSKDYAVFLPKVTNSLRAAWKCKNIPLNRKLSVKLRIDAAGRVRRLKLEESCGNKETDEVFLQLLREPNRFPALPVNSLTGLVPNHITIIFSVAPDAELSGRYARQ